MISYQQSPSMVTVTAEHLKKMIYGKNNCAATGARLSKSRQELELSLSFDLQISRAFKEFKLECSFEQEISCAFKEFKLECSFEQQI